MIECQQSGTEGIFLNSVRSSYEKENKFTLHQAQK